MHRLHRNWYIITLLAVAWSHKTQLTSLGYERSEHYIVSFNMFIIIIIIISSSSSSSSSIIIIITISSSPFLLDITFISI